MTPTPFPIPAPLWRRLAAALYDVLLLVALWIVALLLELLVRNLLELPLSQPFLRAYLFLVGLFFCGWFWTHGGATPGMRAWRLQLRRADGAAVGWGVAVVRYALAWIAWLPLAAGVLWCAIDARRRAWHDIATGTEVVFTSRTHPASSSPAAP